MNEGFTVGGRDFVSPRGRTTAAFAPRRAPNLCFCRSLTFQELQRSQPPEELVNDLVRLCCALCLLENDPELISPEVLADGRAKFDQTGDQKYVEKARRQGKCGWDVGRQIEVIPHYRRPHLMLAWTGAGRSVPKIVPRKGSIVHRNVVEKLPSGFGG
jgi:hypothetical protein